MTFSALSAVIKERLIAMYEVFIIHSKLSAIIRIRRCK